MTGLLSRGDWRHWEITVETSVTTTNPSRRKVSRKYILLSFERWMNWYFILKLFPKDPRKMRGSISSRLPSHRKRVKRLKKTSNPLDGCTFVYLDMGSNIGVQIRWELKCDHPLVMVSNFAENCTNKTSFQEPKLFQFLKNTLVNLREEICWR